MKSRLKSCLKPLLPLVVKLLGCDIRDSTTGRIVGRGLFIPWRGTIKLIGLGHSFLIPRFQSSDGTYYWHQTLEFCQHPPVDFPSAKDRNDPPPSTKTLWCVLAHQESKTVESILAYWHRYVPAEDVLLLYGGKDTGEYAAVSHKNKRFVSDPRLHTRAHILERQSYQGAFRAVAEFISKQSEYSHVFFAESDMLPVGKNIERALLASLEDQDADALFYHLREVTDTNWPHALYHQAFLNFSEIFSNFSIRNDPGIVLNAIGCGSFWRRSAFLDVAKLFEAPVYLELFIPSAAHHLGYRVKSFENQDSFIGVVPLDRSAIEIAISQGALFVHPVKDMANIQ